MSKHTPGPWSHYDDTPAGGGSTNRHEIVAIGKTVARIYHTNGCEAEDTANARLIAAAPDLLEVCKTLLALHDAKVDTRGAWDKTMEEARAAIAKAQPGTE